MQKKIYVYAMSLLFVILLFALSFGDNAVYLSVEEARAIPKSRSPIPYEGSPVLDPIVHECYYCNNYIHTYFICPFREVLRVRNTNPSDRMAVGLYDGAVGSIFRNDVIISSYTDGYSCGDGKTSTCRMEIKCDRSIGAMYEVEAIREINPCETVIVARSPLVCTVAPPPRDISSSKEQSQPTEQSPSNNQSLSKEKMEEALTILHEMKEEIKQLEKDINLLLNRL